MGIKNLFPFLKKHEVLFQTIKLKELSGKTIALDASLMMHKYARTQGDFLKGLVYQVKLLKKHNITPLYVLDPDKPPEEKKDTLDKRRKIHEKAMKDDDGSFEAHKRKFRITNEINEEFKKWCKFMNIYCIQAEFEADITLAQLVKDNICYAAWSEDSDLIAHGCPRLLKKWKKDEMELIELDDILKKTKLSMKQFVYFCIHLGTDYNKRINGPVTSYKLVLNNMETIEFKDEKHLNSLKMFNEKCQVKLPECGEICKNLKEELDKRFPKNRDVWKNSLIKVLN